MNFRIIRAHTDAPQLRTLKRIQRHATNGGGERRPRIETRELCNLCVLTSRY